MKNKNTEKSNSTTQQKLNSLWEINLMTENSISTAQRHANKKDAKTMSKYTQHGENFIKKKLTHLN